MLEWGKDLVEAEKAGRGREWSIVVERKKTANKTPSLAFFFGIWARCFATVLQQIGMPSLFEMSFLESLRLSSLACF